LDTTSEQLLERTPQPLSKKLEDYTEDRNGGEVKRSDDK
jgi:hypothetical protein